MLAFMAFYQKRLRNDWTTEKKIYKPGVSGVFFVKSRRNYVFNNLIEIKGYGSFYIHVLCALPPFI